MELCELICILSMVIKVPPSVDNLACSYCTSVDGLSNECAQDPVNCWQLTSKELLYCLTTFEFRKTMALKTRRCVEHSLFPVDIQILKQLINPTECSFKTAHACNCSTCTLPSSPKNQSSLDENVLNPNYYENALNHNFIKSKMSKNHTNHINRVLKPNKKKAKKLNLELQQKNLGLNNVNKFFVFFLTTLIILY